MTAATQSVSRLGSFGRALSERGANIPVRHSYRYHSPSAVVTAQSNFAYQQNPAIAGIKFTWHEVVSRSLIDFMKMGEPEDYVRVAKDIIVPVPDVPKEQLDYLRTKLP